MLINRKSRLYSSLKWMYQPIKGIKDISQGVNYQLSKKAILNNYKNSEFTGLHIGCGPFYMAGWINTDMLGTPNIDFPLDISAKLPIPDTFLDVIYGSEVIEHIDLEEARQFMREMYRILKPGGVIRLTTPNITEICRLFLDLNQDVKVSDFASTWLEGEFSKEIWINALFRAWGHKYLWTFENFVDELTKVGFANIQRCEPHKTKSDKPQLNNLDNRYGDSEADWQFAHTLIIEAHKPIDNNNNNNN
jgi:predicted SAM-dependent methyltransferase